MTQMQPPHYRLGFRSDIEGLRAIAILLVVAAHAKVSELAGGFVGVDVFFVLSGYLITGLLVQEIQTTQTLRFAAFYARRLRRLLPALLLMLVVSGVLGWLLVAPSEQAGQATAAASAALWVSNFYFAFANLGYFSPGAETSLFLHTWSLGVEEQFYLIWPLFLMLALGAWEGSRQPFNLARLKLTMQVIFIASLLLCVYWTYKQPELAFYMMPARTWQFALGALVFLHFGSPNTENDGSRTDDGLDRSSLRLALLQLSGWLGLALILLAALVLDTHMAYPGMWALLPSMGAAMILAAGAKKPRDGVGKLLSIPPMQAIGRVSYAWYLWHWPILLLGATLMSLDSAAYRLALVVVSFLLAVGSYYLIETPIRRNQRLAVRPGRFVLAAVVLMLLANVSGIRWHNNAQARMNQPEQVRYLTARSDAPIIYRMGCDDWYHSAKVEICAFGPKDATHTAIAIGDSIALQWFPAFAEVFNKPGWRLLVMTKSSCPMVDEPMFYPRIGREYVNCEIWRNDALLQLAELKPDIVIMGSAIYGFTREELVRGTKSVLNTISSAAGHVFILRSTPKLPFDGPSCLAPRSWLYTAISSKSQCMATWDNPSSNSVHQWLQAAASEFNNVSTIDMTDTICPQGHCRALRDGIIVFRDSQHLSATFARSLGPELGLRFGATIRESGSISPGSSASPATQ